MCKSALVQVIAWCGQDNSELNHIPPEHIAEKLQTINSSTVYPRELVSFDILMR